MCRDTQVFLPSVFFVFLFEKLSFFYTNRDKTLNAMGAKRGFVPYAPVPLFLFFFSLFLFCCCSLPFSMFASLRVKLVSTLQSRVVTHTHTHTHRKSPTLLQQPLRDLKAVIRHLWHRIKKKKISGLDPNVKEIQQQPLKKKKKLYIYIYIEI